MIDCKHVVDLVGITIIECKQHRGDINYIGHKLVHILDQVGQLYGCGECGADVL
jgi:hypothetical protein